MKDNFSKYARSKGVNSLALHQYMQSKNSINLTKPNISLPIGMTPMVIETNQLNTSTISVFDRLMMDRIIFLGEAIDDFVANVINAQLLFLSSEEDNNEAIWTYINSPGGECYSSLAIYDTMQIISSDVYTCTMGLAASMGFVLAISGKKGHRYALKHSRLMQHQPWQGGGGGMASDVEIGNRELQGLKSDLLNIISLHTGQDIAKVKEDCDRDYWMTTAKAIEYGAIDKILLKI